MEKAKKMHFCVALLCGIYGYVSKFNLYKGNLGTFDKGRLSIARRHFQRASPLK